MPQLEKRIARICWNENGWKQPTGNSGKSTNKEAYENYAGFGWEEWLFDLEKAIGGYHYSFIEAINRHWKKYEGKKMDLSLFTIHRREKWWLGTINNVEVISPSESDSIYAAYEQNGWVEERKAQLESVNADTTQLVHGQPFHFFNIRFSPEDLDLCPTPLLLAEDDNCLRAYYTSSLYYYKTAPKLVHPSTSSQAPSTPTTPLQLQSPQEWESGGATYLEGKVSTIKVNRYERDRNARKRCIEHFGAKCQVCEMEFEAVYGDIGKDFIHVHHLREISSIGKAYYVDPINDLVPVCPNCHAMLHTQTPALTIEALKSRLQPHRFFTSPLSSKYSTNTSAINSLYEGV